MAADITKCIILKYEIENFSSYSSNYLPQNILVNQPEDQSSRWSSDSNQPPQFLLLRLNQPAIVTNIVFGKYEKTHVCNVKKLKVFGGLDKDNLIELLDSGLKNDNIEEVFLLRHKIDGNHFPCKYIKIVPLQSWGPSFNFSIWFVQLRGFDDQAAVKQCLNWYNEYREREAVRLCLKHFRQRNYIEAYAALQKRTKISLEHPALTRLHELLVRNGDFAASEQLMESAVNDGLFDYYIGLQDYKTHWMLINPVYKGPDGSSSNVVSGVYQGDLRPGMRGGHQMCIDVQSDMVYLFGGWDGSRDLADFWVYSSAADCWTCLSRNTREQGGPSPRSCHKMCLDEIHKEIFTLGRYLDPSLRTNTNIYSDFHVYDIERNKWTLISNDTQAVGGPGLIFDHQMVIDTEKRTIYVFGGRVLVSTTDTDRSSEPVFSGLYSYHIPTSTWCRLRNDEPELRTRVGHSMLFHSKQRCLYIFAGQRNKEYLNDFVIYDVDLDTIRVISDGSSANNMMTVPSVGFTQRATIDADLQEIYVLTGLSKDREKSDTVQNSLWIYDIVKNSWTCVYSRESSTSEGCSSRSQHQCIEPVPRYAHQLVYNHATKVHYLFGGNPGSTNQLKMRLDDFWCLQLCRPTHKEVLRRCRYLIRKHRYEEMSHTDPIAALRFLQTELFAIVNHGDAQEHSEFQALPTLLFHEKSPTSSSSSTDLSSSSDMPSVHFEKRTRLFDKLVLYFPDDMTQPRENIIDLINIH